jgi:DNA-binding CsgD family transcriptional regulator
LFELSDLLLLLHQECRQKTCQEFYPWALSLIAPVLPFDKAMWNSRVLVKGHLLIHDSHLHQLSETDLELFNRYSALDPVANAYLASPGKTFFRDIHDTRNTNPEFARLVLTPTQIAYGLVTYAVDKTTGIVDALALLRQPSSPAFTEQQREFKQALMPHLHLALMENRIAQADSGTQASYGRLYHSIVCSTAALVIATQDKATELLLKQWPQWLGGAMPMPIKEQIELALATGSPSHWLGETVLVRVFPASDRVLIRIRERNVTDTLAPKERLVAERFANGDSAKKIAQELSLSPSTVSNHLASVYAKLNIQSKTELTKMMDQLG